MQFRLPHILALMGLVLLAGVLGAQQLESRVGATTVPGLVVLDCPDLSVPSAEALVVQFDRVSGQPLWVAADDQPLSPFDGQRARSLRAQGYASACVHLASVPPAGADDAARRAWGVLLEDVPASKAVAVVADFVRAQHGVRPFIVALQLGSTSAAELVADVAPLLQAAESLPSFRRTSVVVLGAREPATSRRLALRIDRGPWEKHARPALQDLLAGE